MAAHEEVEKRGSANEPLDVILPAGGRITGEFAQAASVELKALIRIDGSGGPTILGQTIETVRATQRINRIVVVGPDVVQQEARRYGAIAMPEGASGPDNIYLALEWLEPASRVLILTTDLPFLTVGALNRFIESASAAAELVVPLVSRESYERRFPGTGNAFVRLRDGEFTLGCAFLAQGTALTRSRGKINRIFEARKSQWAMVRLLGPLFVARFATRRLNVAQIERRCTSLVGCRGVAVPDCPAELAFDIDQLEEFNYACQHRAECIPA